MKVLRTYPIWIALALSYALVAATAQTISYAKEPANESISSGQPQQAEHQGNGSTTTYGEKITIYLHGLMVGRLYTGQNGKKDQQRLEVGIVRRAPEHNLSFTVYSTSCDGTLPEAQTHEITPTNNTRYVLKVKSQAEDDIGAIETMGDFGLILNMEKLKSDKPLTMNKRAFDYVFDFHNGKVSVACKTMELLARKVEHAELPQPPSGGQPDPLEENIGSIAEVVAIEIMLNKGQTLVLADTKGNEIWKNEYAPNKKIEVPLLNVRSGHDNPGYHVYTSYKDYACVCQPGDKKMDPEDYISGKYKPVARDYDGKPTDFQLYYYLVFPVDRPDRYELITKHICVVDRNKFTTPPYQCGMVLVSNFPITID